MKILIADTQPVVIEGIKSFLSQFNNIKSVDEAEDRNSLLDKSRTYKPDILIIDLECISDFNVNEINLIEELSPLTNLFIYSNNIHEDAVLKILEFKSVKAYHLKNCKKIDFIRAVTVIANNGKSFCDSVIECLHNNLTKSNKPVIKAIENKELTKREIEIVKLVAEGKTAKEIAEKLLISVHTVNTYRKNILKKLDVKNSSELVMFVLKNQIINSTEYYI